MQVKIKKLFDSKESVVNIGDGLFGASGICGSYSSVCAVIVGEGWHTLLFRK